MNPKELDKMIRTIKDLPKNQLKRVWKAADKELISRLMVESRPQPDKWQKR